MIVREKLGDSTFGTEEQKLWSSSMMCIEAVLLESLYSKYGLTHEHNYYDEICVS